MILRRLTKHVKDQNWFAVALDFAVVVIGILIAFQITSWNEQRQDKARERAYLARIAAELDHTITEIDSAIRIAASRQALGEYLIAAAANPDAVREDPERFINALIIGGYTFSPNIRSHAFDEMQSAGASNLLRDAALRFDLTEFYTNIRGNEQWVYLRELGQTEYTRRAAGILTYEQQRAVAAAFYDVTQADPVQGVTEDDALAAHARMMARPDFVEWLPVVTLRFYEISIYSQWLDQARSLRARIDVPAAPPLGVNP